jgi:hypothetical protein
MAGRLTVERVTVKNRRRAVKRDADLEVGRPAPRRGRLPPYLQAVLLALPGLEQL